MSIFNSETYANHAALFEAISEGLVRDTMKATINAERAGGKKIIDRQSQIDNQAKRLQHLVLEFLFLDQEHGEAIAALARDWSSDIPTVLNWVFAELITDGECRFIDKNKQEVVITASAELRLLLTLLVEEKIPSFSTLLLDVLAKTPTKSATQDETNAAAVQENTTEPGIEVPAVDQALELETAEPTHESNNPELNEAVAQTIAVIWAAGDRKQFDYRSVRGTVQLLEAMRTLSKGDWGVPLTYQILGDTLQISSEGARKRIVIAQGILSQLEEELLLSLHIKEGRPTTLYLLPKSTESETDTQTENPEQTEQEAYAQSRQFVEAASRGRKTKVDIFDYLHGLYSRLTPPQRMQADGITVWTLMQLFQITQTVANRHLRTIEKILNQNGAPLRLIPQEDGRKFRWKLVSSADYTQTVTAEQPDNVVIETDTLVPADEEQQAEADPVTITVELLKAQLRTTRLVPVFERICEIWAAQGTRKRTLSRKQILMEDGQPISKWLLERLSLILAQIEAPYQLVCFSNTTPHVWLLMTLEDLESRRSEITRSLGTQNLTVVAEPNHLALSSTEISRLDAVLYDPPPKPAAADHKAPAGGRSEPEEKKS